MSHHYHPNYNSNDTPVLAGFRIQWDTSKPLPDKTQLGSTQRAWGTSGTWCHDANGNAIYLGSSRIGNAVIPGYLDPAAGNVVHYGLDGKDVIHHGTFEILPIADDTEWVHAVKPKIVERPVIGGYDPNGHPLYHAIAKTFDGHNHFKWGWALGKTGFHKTDCTAYRQEAAIPFDGKDQTFEDYYVLCWKEGQGAYSPAAVAKRAAEEEAATKAASQASGTIDTFGQDYLDVLTSSQKTAVEAYYRPESKLKVVIDNGSPIPAALQDVVGATDIVKHLQIAQYYLGITEYRALSETAVSDQGDGLLVLVSGEAYTYQGTSMPFSLTLHLHKSTVPQSQNLKWHIHSQIIHHHSLDQSPLESPDLDLVDVRGRWEEGLPPRIGPTPNNHPGHRGPPFRVGPKPNTPGHLPFRVGPVPNHPEWWSYPQNRMFRSPGRKGPFDPWGGRRGWPWDVVI